MCCELLMPIAQTVSEHLSLSAACPSIDLLGPMTLLDFIISFFSHLTMKMTKKKLRREAAHCRKKDVWTKTTGQDTICAASSHSLIYEPIQVCKWRVLWETHHRCVFAESRSGLSTTNNNSISNNPKSSARERKKTFCLDVITIISSAAPLIRH